MNIKEIFKEVTFDTFTQEIYDLDGCMVGVFMKYENGIIIDYQGHTRFVDEYDLEKHLEEDIAQPLIEWINENNY